MITNTLPIKYRMLLHPRCQKCAIFDLIDGHIYALTSDESRTIEACEENSEVDP